MYVQKIRINNEAHEILNIKWELMSFEELTGLLPENEILNELNKFPSDYANKFQQTWNLRNDTLAYTNGDLFKIHWNYVEFSSEWIGWPWWYTIWGAQ